MILLSFLLATIIGAIVIHLLKAAYHDIDDALEDYYKELGE